MEKSQMTKLEEFRTKRVFSLLPFIVVNGFENDFVWTGKWFKFVEITQQKVKERYAEFDDGWSYSYYWGKWKECWYFLKIN